MLTVVVEFVSDWTDRACGGAARTCTDAGAGAGGAANTAAGAGGDGSGGGTDRVVGA